MKLKRNYPSKEDVPESVKEHYKEVDGAWVLDVDGSKTEEDVAKSMKALVSERELHKQAKADLKVAQDAVALFDGLDANAAREALETAASKGDTGSADVIELKKQMRQLTGRHEQLVKENTAKDEALRLFSTEKKKTIIQDALRQAAANAGIRSEAMRDVLRCAGEFDVDDTDQVATADGVNVPDFIAAQLESAPHWLEASKGGNAHAGNKTGTQKAGDWVDTIKSVP